MYSFTTLPELFEHIQQNVKSESYLNYRNSEKWESISSDEFVKHDGEVQERDRSDLHARREMNKVYVISDTDKTFKKEYDRNRLNYQMLQGGVR